MGLFSTVIDTSVEPTKRSDLATVVEFCAKKPLLATAVVAISMPSYAPVHYSAIQTDAIFEANVKGMRSIKQEIIPDLGIWSVPCCGAKMVIDDLVPKDPSTVVFVWTMDLTEIPHDEVEPMVNFQQQALIRHLIQHPRVEKSLEIAMTSLELLKTNQFGLAPDDAAATPAESKTQQDESPEDKANVICLQICVKIPPRSDDVTEQQKLAYVIYHFHKFAIATQASLVFVSEEEPQATLGTVLPKDVGMIWKALAQGKEVWNIKNFQEETPVGEENDALIYGPGAQTELLDSVWQRNASAPGKWNASKDSMWTVFPPESKASGKTTTPKIPPGDEGWLSELRNSMANVTTTTTAQSPQKDSSSKAQSATPNDKAVSSFFKDLLNN
jgi:hypothetical protein